MDSRHTIKWRLDDNGTMLKLYGARPVRVPQVPLASRSCSSTTLPDWVTWEGSVSQDGLEGPSGCADSALHALALLPLKLLRCHKQLLFMQVLVVMPPGAVGNAHPVRALQLGEAVACAPRDRSECHMLLIASAIFVSPTSAWGMLVPSLVFKRLIVAPQARQWCHVRGESLADCAASRLSACAGTLCTSALCRQQQPPEQTCSKQPKP